MRTTYLRVSLFLASVALPMVAIGQPPITKATISPVVPTEVVDGMGANLPVNVSQLPLDFFDDFSWRSFVALNWPAKSGVRGVPDSMKPIGDVAAPRVWETWKTTYEIAPPNANVNPPTEWSSFDGQTPCASVPPVGSGKVRLLATISPFGNFNQAGFDSVGGPLVCQNQTYTLYETRVNEQEYKFIRDNKLYLQSKLEAASLAAKPLKFTDGSIEVKAAWREFTASDTESFRKTFYRITASTKHPITGVCSQKEFGLTGLHIVHKTPLRPQWVWSSFEHIANVEGTTRSYNDPTKPQVTDGFPATLDATNFSATPTPTQVIRDKPLHPAAGPSVIGTAATNKRYQTALAGTVWVNYQLVTTQWPTNTIDSTQSPVAPHEDFLGNPFPDSGTGTSVANTALETYDQQFTSCMECHDIARGKKTDFVFFIHFHAFDDTVVTPKKKPLVAEDLNKLRSVIKSKLDLLKK